MAQVFYILNFKVIKEINTLIDGEDSLDIFPHQAGK